MPVVITGQGGARVPVEITAAAPAEPEVVIANRRYDNCDRDWVPFLPLPGKSRMGGRGERGVTAMIIACFTDTPVLKHCGMPPSGTTVRCFGGQSRQEIPARLLSSVPAALVTILGFPCRRSAYFERHTYQRAESIERWSMMVPFNKILYQLYE